MNDETLETILECLQNHEASNVKRIQTAHRLKLAEFWGINAGSKILEIGCGQGDTTAVLAYMVGKEGFVHGVDIAPPTYGSPITVGAAAEYLQASPLGQQINMEYEVDVLAPESDFPEKSYDIIILSHCSWYLKSQEELREILRKARKWGKQLCYAEWDPRIKTIEQLPHLLATLIQAQYEVYKENSSSNLRTFMTPSDVKTIAKETGWTITGEQMISSPDFQDAQWEVSMTLKDGPIQLAELNHLPAKLKSLLQSELDLLEESAQTKTLQPMSTFAFIAH